MPQTAHSASNPLPLHPEVLLALLLPKTQADLSFPNLTGLCWEGQPAWVPATPSPGPSQAVLSIELPQDGLPGGRFGPSRAAPGGPGRSLRAPRRLRPAPEALERPGQGGNFGEGFVAQPKLRLRRRRGSVVVRQRARSLFVRLWWPNSEEMWHGWHPPQRLGLC